MYTYRQAEDTEYYIYDAEGICIACVATEEEAQALLSHLNRS